jgi:hypothetical protein
LLVKLSSQSSRLLAQAADSLEYRLSFGVICGNDTAI